MSPQSVINARLGGIGLNGNGVGFNVDAVEQRNWPTGTPVYEAREGHKVVLSANQVATLLRLDARS